MQEVVPSPELTKIINHALDEDLGENGDITSNLTIDESKRVKFQISNREEIILCGSQVAISVFHEVKKRLGINDELAIRCNFNDGDLLKENQIIISGTVNARLLFACERVALNLLQHLSGIATITQQYVSQIDSNKTKILDTRKTIPGLRTLQKYAVKTGGGQNHRFALYDGILIKDNHIAAAGSISEAVSRSQGTGLKIEVECDNIEQVKEAVTAKADIIMLDNMDLEQIKEAVKAIDGRAKIEVSGGITLKRIKEISQTNVDYISIGSLTHSVKAVDIGLDII